MILPILIFFFQICKAFIFKHQKTLATKLANFHFLPTLGSRKKKDLLESTPSAFSLSSALLKASSLENPEDGMDMPPP
jgi:hypothetical protein